MQMINYILQLKQKKKKSMKDIHEMPEDLLFKIRVIEMMLSFLSRVSYQTFMTFYFFYSNHWEIGNYWKCRSDGISPLPVKKHFDARVVLENISNPLLGLFTQQRFI